jgi:hypothetical protein
MSTAGKFSILGFRVDDMDSPEVIAERFRAYTVTMDEVVDSLAAWGQWLRSSTPVGDDE